MLATKAQTPFRTDGLGACELPGWRGELNTTLPHFVSPRMPGVCREVREEIAGYLVDAVGELAVQAAADGLPLTCVPTMLLAAQTTRYGAIYWLTQLDALVALARRPRLDEGMLDACGAWFEQGTVLHQLWHGVVLRFITAPQRCHVIDNHHVPPGGFQPLSATVLCVREADRSDILSGSSAQTETFDLHDFAHYAAACVSPDLYANKLHSAAFRSLPEQLVDLVAGFNSSQTPQHADGTVFGGLLGHLFNERDEQEDPEWVIVGELARSIVPYMLGEEALYLPSRQRNVSPSRPVSVWELAVLAQNKAYEAPASELEQLLFTRGGADGRDALEPLTTSERVHAIAMLQGRTFHEARNTLKHRAHVLAYELTIEELWRQRGLDPAECAIAGATLKHLRFADYHLGSRRELFRDVANHLAGGAGAELGPYPLLDGG